VTAVRARPIALLLLLATARPAAASPPTRVSVTGPRVRVGDVLPDAPPDAAAVDLGPAPAAGGTRLIEREAILRALRERQATEPARIPESVRVSRRTRTLTAAEVERLVRDALPPERLPRGAALAAVRPPRALEVPAGWSAVAAELPRAPRRAGPFATTAYVSFLLDGDTLARVPVPIELTLPAGAATPDLARGAAVTLAVRRGLVEVRASASAGADADVGDTLPVVLRPAGRVIRARLVARDLAVALEEP
jgi:hypothetical protein